MSLPPRYEFIYQRMERDPAFRAEIHKAIGCCEDGNCKKSQEAIVMMEDFTAEDE